MYCPCCNFEYDPHDRFCSHCGASLTVAQKKTYGRHWVPILIMVLIFAFGTTLFFVLPGSGSQHVRGTSSEDMPWFMVDDGILYFRKSYYSGSGELVIPESVGGITVTAISDSCFENCSGLTSVVLPASVQAIGENAFRGCTSLRGIEIPESVVLIGEGAFAGCTSLEALCIYDSIQSIGAGAFTGCTKLFYIYYSGYFEDWNELYSEFINPYTTVFSLDGTFYQGEMAN